MHKIRDSSGSSEQRSWQPSRGAAISLRAGSVGMSLAMPVLALLVTRDLWHEPSGGSAMIAWWVGILVLCGVVFVLAERLGRRARILADLMEMKMLFPGPAPRRLAVARQVSEMAASPDGYAQALRDDRPAADPAAASATIVAAALASQSRRACGAGSASWRATHGHPARVMTSTESVAQVLDLTDADRDRLRWAALVHDLGVSPGPDRDPRADPRLDASSRPTGARRRAPAHLLHSAKIAAPLMAWLGEWAPAVAQHHEHFDGGGYPDGLRGEQISFGGRIVAVTHAYDILTTAGPGRPALSHEAARSELAAGAGALFDPAVVRAFLAAPAQGARGPSRRYGLWPVAAGGSQSATASRAAVALLASAALVLLGGNITKGDVISTAASAKGAGNHNIGASLARLAGGATRAVYRSLPPDGSTDRSGNRAGAGQALAAPGRLLGSDTSPGPNGTSGPNATSGPRHASGGSVTATATTTTSVPGHGASPPTTSVGTPPTTSRPPSTTTTTTTTTTSAPPPAPPDDLQAAASCSGLWTAVVELTWDEAETRLVSSYEIMRKTAQSAYTVIATVSAGTKSYTDSSVSELATTYWYEVKAIGSGTATSSPVEVTTPAVCV